MDRGNVENSVEKKNHNDTTSIFHLHNITDKHFFVIPPIPMEIMCTHISFASNNSVLDKMFFPFVQVGTCCQDHIKNKI